MADWNSVGRVLAWWSVVDGRWSVMQQGLSHACEIREIVFLSAGLKFLYVGRLVRT